MKVTVSVAGRFHAFYLAQQLLKRGFLNKLITSYPKYEVKKYGIPKDKVKSIILKEIMYRTWDKLPELIKRLYNPQYLIANIYDKSAARTLEETDIFVGWSSKSLYSLRKIKKMGAKTILERGSTHMLYQQQVLQEECEICGIKYTDIHPKIIEKELMEYSETDYISIPSSFVRRTFAEKGIPEEKLIHVPYGVNLDEFHQILKNDKIFRIVFSGTLSIQKGIHYLLKAFYELKLPNAELLLIGVLNSNINPFLRKYPGCFKLTGHLPQKELYKYYSQSSVFVMPSIQEGLAMVQVQAMACGLPLICTTNTGGEDVIEDGSEGFIIPIRNIDKLKEKIMFFYENPEKCYKMGQKAKRKVQKSFSWDDYGNRIIHEYNKVLKYK